MNRRAFNRFAAGALFSYGLPPLPAQTVDSEWKLGIITDQVDFDLERVLAGFYRKYLLHWAEIRYLKLGGENRYAYTDATPEQLGLVRRRLDDNGIKVSVLDTAVYKIALPGTAPTLDAPAYGNARHHVFAHQLEDLKHAADAAHALGTERVRIFTFLRVLNPATVFSRVVEQLEKAIAVAKQEGVTLLIENEYDTNVGTGEEISQLFRAIPDKRLMHNWDPCNCYEMGEQPFPTVWEQLDHDRISHIHLKDAAGKEWKPIGSGVIDFEGQLRALKRMRYSGTLSVETRYRDLQHDAYASSVESMDGLIRVLNKV